MQKVEKILILVKFFDFTRHYAEICQLRGTASITRSASRPRNREFGCALHTVHPELPGTYSLQNFQVLPHHAYTEVPSLA